MTIVEFLNARLDEDETKAKAARGATWVASQRGGVVDLDDDRGKEVTGGDGGLAWSDADFMAHHDPARVLREVEAKRAILNLRDALTDRRAALSEYTMRTTHTEAGIESYDHVVQHMAAVYADHPDYQQEWTP